MPNPPLFYDLLEKMEEKKKVTINKSPARLLEKIIPLKEPDLTVFSKFETELMEQIAKKHYSDSASDIEKLAQSEAPYKMSTHGEVIPYHLAFYRHSFGEMNLNEL